MDCYHLCFQKLQQPLELLKTRVILNLNYRISTSDILLSLTFLRKIRLHTQSYPLSTIVLLV